MTSTLTVVLLGFASGFLSGMFGIGGGVITTPAIRMLLDAPALVAVGTPLVAIIPGAITGAVSYTRSKMADVRGGVIIGLMGSVFAVLGAGLTRLVGGTVVLVATAAVILYTAADMLFQVAAESRRDSGRTGTPAGEHGEEADAFGPRDDVVLESVKEPVRRVPVLLGVGAVAGFYSGFLGLGGGFIIVPLLTRWLKFPIKRAVGTSLLSISILAIPGMVTHLLLGNIDTRIALALMVGVVPGALLGARVSLGASDRVLRLGFACLLIAAGLWLAMSELTGMGAR